MYLFDCLFSQDDWQLLFPNLHLILTHISDTNYALKEKCADYIWFITTWLCILQLHRKTKTVKQ